MTDRLCGCCSQPLVRPKRISAEKWRTRQFCDDACSRAAKRRSCTRPCAHCGEVFAAQGMKRKYCSLRCSARNRGAPRYRKSGGKLEHRQVMEESIGRPLKPFETVHHKNGRRLDNSLGNLELWVKPQPAGQRVEDLLEWVIQHYRDELAARLVRMMEGTEH